MNQRANAPEGLRSGEASGRHQGLRRPSDAERIERALHVVSLEELGDVVEDQLRDRRSSGLPVADDGDNATSRKLQRRRQ
ncbi:hypothetical protein [Lysobacter sp. CFH 32150]|uniref:hypothetical protein n=1 Tax=Lysobacter sp. CFH 32150 TaxID=2927128 RepID=UPI001FA7EF08|nr:hypothetical protein [Lysobacter sp. CFH 32150]MCI4568438.1 hypothetical protein [Lysobacter sp. CFH 32150]